MRSRVSHALPAVALLLVASLFGVLLFKHISYPLLWRRSRHGEEGEQRGFGRRVLEFGYPKVHGEKNVLYGLKGGLGSVDEPPRAGCARRGAR